MRLKPRLRAIAEVIPPCRVAADIGTDHAYLPVCLVEEGRASRVIAVENRPAAVRRAQATVDRFHLSQAVEVRLGDGLLPLRREDGVEVAVLAGLGGHSIYRILEAARDRWSWFRCLVLQPAQHAAQLRRRLAAGGLRLVKEKLAREGSRFYEIMVVMPGRQDIDDPLLFDVGPCLVRDGDPLLVPFLEYKLQTCRQIMCRLQEAASGQQQRLALLRRQETRLKEMLASVRYR